jgi:two-component system chemotaxis response regulator CheY
MAKKLLTVDDSPSVRKLVEFTLKTKGFQVSSAGNGMEALKLMSKEQFDAIVLDINMPLMNGLEFLQEIRADEAFTSIPVVMLTTEGQDEDKDKAISLGATAYIVKPFKPTRLLSLIEKILPPS